MLVLAWSCFLLLGCAQSSVDVSGTGGSNATGGNNGHQGRAGRRQERAAPPALVEATPAPEETPAPAGATPAPAGRPPPAVTSGAAGAKGTGGSAGSKGTGGSKATGGATGTGGAKGTGGSTGTGGTTGTGAAETSLHDHRDLVVQLGDPDGGDRDLHDDALEPHQGGDRLRPRRRRDHDGGARRSHAGQLPHAAPRDEGEHQLRLQDCRHQRQRLLHQQQLHDHAPAPCPARRPR